MTSTSLALWLSLQSLKSSSMLTPPIDILCESLGQTTGATVRHDELPAEVQEARVVFFEDLQKRWVFEIDLCTHDHYFWFNCCLLDPRFKSLKNILGVTSTQKTEARASFDSLYHMLWEPVLELSTDSKRLRRAVY